jgi:hypothetical protein
MLTYVGMAMGVLINMCISSAGTNAVKAVLYEKKNGSQQALAGIFRILDMHSSNTNLVNFGCLLLFRTTQGDPDTLQLLRAARETVEIEALVCECVCVSVCVGCVCVCVCVCVCTVSDLFCFRET